MIDETSDFLETNKRKDLIARLNSKRVDQALPAEIEMAILWSMLKTNRAEIEPDWWPGEKRPDLVVLSDTGEALQVIEIAATTDNSMSAEPLMHECSTLICNYADSVVPKSGRYLYFQYHEYNTRVENKIMRNVAAPKGLVLTPAVKQELRAWLTDSTQEGAQLRLTADGLDVTIERKNYPQIKFHNYWTTRPPITYSEIDNPLYELLTRKVAQVADAPSGVTRVILVADVGSDVLSGIFSSMGNFGLNSQPTAKSIISRFLVDRKSEVDAVVVLSPEQKELNFWRNTAPNWRLAYFGLKESADLRQTLDAAVNLLPNPRFSGQQARSLFRQQTFSHSARGWYLGESITMKQDAITFRMSARLLQEFIEGKISEKSFRHFMGEGLDGPSLRRFLDSGYTISAASIQKSGIDNDDDLIVFTLEKDPAAKAFE